MRLKLFFCSFLAVLCSTASSAEFSAPMSVATFSDDIAFLRRHTDIIVLRDNRGNAQVAVAPSWQGRVMTSAAEGEGGASFGWINRDLISSGELQPHINVFGGEDRLWLRPEGSQFSIYFAKGMPFSGDHWFVPKALDTLPFKVVSHSSADATLQAEFTLANYSGTHFQVAIRREVRLLENVTAWHHLGVAPLDRVALVAYESNNTLINAGREAWRKDTGLLSIWILGMFNSSPSATVAVPIKAGSESELGAKVTTYEAYGAIPPERLKATGNTIFFRGDGKYRSKIGVNPRRSLGKLGSYDAARRVLTIVQFSQPQGVNDYVNSLWGPQEAPYGGDAINSYNDGPPAPGTKSLGPFFELESSSPAVALEPGGSLEHTHRTLHLAGPRGELDSVASAVLGVSLAQIEAALPSD